MSVGVHMLQRRRVVAVVAGVAAAVGGSARKRIASGRSRW